jgi:GntR family transcriptional regulator
MMGGELAWPTLRAVTVDHGSPVPAYAQLADILRGKIREGAWRHGPLPSVRQLHQEYGVGRDTATRALEVLVSEGLIFSVPRRGYYVQAVE